MTELAFMLPAAAVEAIAQRAAELVLEQLRTEQSDARTLSPYASIEQAAAYLACDKQRIYDLRSAGRLTRYAERAPEAKHGRALVSWAELEALVEVDGAPAELPSRPRRGSLRAVEG